MEGDFSPFELRLEFEFESVAEPNHRFESLSPERIELQAAWTAFWKAFVDEVCNPPHRGPIRAMTHDGAYDPGRASGLLGFNFPNQPIFNATAVHPRDLAEGTLRAAFEGRGVVTAPSSAFIASISSEEIAVRDEHFAVAFGASMDEDGRWQFGRLFDFEMQSLEAWEGSLRARGTILIKAVGSSLVLPLAIAAFGAATAPQLGLPIGKFMARQKIESRLMSADVSCVTETRFSFDREQLIQQLEKQMSLSKPMGICQVQAALYALDLSPGKIDGKMGPRTVAAMETFEMRYQLPSHSHNKPVFFNALARALTGEQPPSK